MKSIFYIFTISAFVVASFSIFIAPATAEGDLNPDGLWLAAEKQDVAIDIEKCGDTLCGKITWMNEITKSKTPHICNVSVLSEFSAATDTPGKWVGGTIYRPSKDAYYSGILRQVSDSEVKLRAYKGAPGLGKTVEFVKVSPNDYPPCETVVAEGSSTDNQR